MGKGLLIVFEGIDGAGKTTQVDMLFPYLKGRNLPVVKSKEPTDGPFGQQIRRLARTRRSLSPEEELSLFIEDRKEHVSTFIRPALKKDKIVIIDRYYFSTMAYQGALGIDPYRIKQLNEEFAPIPDLLFWIDISPRIGLLRIKNRRRVAFSTFEDEDYLCKVREIFSCLNLPYLIRLDGHTSKEVLSNYVRNIMDEVIPSLMVS